MFASPMVAVSLCACALRAYHARILMCGATAIGLVVANTVIAAGLGSLHLHLEIATDHGRFELLDKAADGGWISIPTQPRLGEVSDTHRNQNGDVALAQNAVHKSERGLELVILPDASQPQAAIKVRIQPKASRDELWTPSTQP